METESLTATMTERIGSKLGDISNSHYYYYYDSSSSDQSSDTELYSEVGYGSGHSENSLFSSDEEALLRQNFYRRRSFTKRVRRKNKRKTELESDSASDGTFMRLSSKEQGNIKSYSAGSKKSQKSLSGHETDLSARVHFLQLDEKSFQAERELILPFSSPPPEKFDELTKRHHSTGDSSSWHHLNGFEFQTRISRDSPVSALQKRKSWTDSGVSLSKTDSTGSSLAGRSNRSSSKASCRSSYISTEADMVYDNFRAEEDNSSYCESTQRSASSSGQGHTGIVREDSAYGNSLPRDHRTSRASSVDSRISPQCISSCQCGRDCLPDSGRQSKYRNSLPVSEYDTPNNYFLQLLEHSSHSDELTNSAISKEEVNQVTTSSMKDGAFSDCGSTPRDTNGSTPRDTSGSTSRDVSGSSTPRSLHDQNYQIQTQCSLEESIFGRFTFSPRRPTNVGKYDSPLLNAAGELITLVNSKRFSGQRISFDDTQYTPKEKEILEQVFKNAEHSKKNDTDGVKTNSPRGNQGSSFPLPDHLNYPLCMYYPMDASKENKGRGFLKGLKKLKETMKLRKTSKGSPAAKIVEDQQEFKDDVSLASLGTNHKKSHGAASKGRRLIQRMLSRSSGRSLKFQAERSPSRDDIGFRRSRSGSTRSIPESIRSMWGRARSRSVENIRSAFDRSGGKNSNKLPRTNSTFSLFARKRSGSTDQLSSFGQEKRSVLGGRRSESMRSLSAVGGFDIAVRLLSSSSHRCRGAHDHPVNSDFHDNLPQSSEPNGRHSRRQSMISRDSVPNFYGLQGHLMRGGCQDDCCMDDDSCCRYSCYCEDCEAYDYDRCSLCDEGGCCDHEFDYEPEDEFVMGEFGHGGRSYNNGQGYLSQQVDNEMVLAPLNVTVTQERVAERRILSNANRDKLDTYV